MIKKLILALTLFTSTLAAQNTIQWSLWVEQPNQPAQEVIQFPAALDKPFTAQRKVNQITIDCSLMPNSSGYTVFKAVATHNDRGVDMYFTLRGRYRDGVAYCLNGPVAQSEIYRQSPHDVDARVVTTIAQQAIPMVAVQTAGGFWAALSDTPAAFNNFTSQAFDPKERLIQLCSGDNGKTPGIQPDTTTVLPLDTNALAERKSAPGKVLPYYHTVDRNHPHTFEGIIFSSNAKQLEGLRRDVNKYAALHFSKGEYNDYFGGLAFTTAYMNLRANETGKSKYWVVPSIEKSNAQNSRDAFWMATMLPAPYDAACMAHELDTVHPFGENPLLAIIWAYRVFKQQKTIDTAKVQAYVDEIERHSRNNQYYAYDERADCQDFQYWGDVVAFEIDDVITFNQGLFALALYAAKAMGLRFTTDPDEAVLNYRSLYNPELDFYPLSRQKSTILGPDPLVPDLLGQMYFDIVMLDTVTVQRHFDRMVRYAKTPFGFKVLADADGSYAATNDFDARDFISKANVEKMPNGQFLKGGSYFLFDNLFLIDAYLHGVENAEKELIERVCLEFKRGKTTYETVNTKTGEITNPNMGWNVAVYAFWKQLVLEGKADGKLFDAVNKVVRD
jgi:hypothetical protein